MTDTSKTGKGVLDAAISPDGKRMAVVATQLGKDGRSELVFAKPDDFLLQNAKDLQDVPACKAIWRPDGLELSSCRPTTASPAATGELVRISAEEPAAGPAARSSSTATTPSSSR